MHRIALISSRKLLMGPQRTVASRLLPIYPSVASFSSSTAATPALVKQLRALTGSPLKDCMAALVETDGDVEASKEYLRKKGLAQAEKKMDRVAAEGLIAVKEDKDNQKVTMVQIACETDFVAKTEQF